MSSEAAPATFPIAPPPSDAPAARSVGAWLRFGLVGVLGLAFDLWSKYWAFSALGFGDRRVIIPGVLEFQIMLNSGALFGIGAGRTSLFVIASLFALVLVVWMFVQSTRGNWLLHIALGGILAGALGNMYDRMTVQLAEDSGRRFLEFVEERDGGFVFRSFPPQSPEQRIILSEMPEMVGHVRDFIKIPTKLWGEQDLWPWVFNVADMLLVGGVGILAVFLWRDRPPAQGEAAPRSGSSEDTSAEAESRP